MSVGLLAGLHKCYRMDLYEKKEKMDSGPTSIPSNFVTYLDHYLETKKYQRPGFSYLLLSHFKEIKHAWGRFALSELLPLYMQQVTFKYHSLLYTCTYIATAINRHIKVF